jgi:predicted O-methyltransferase YrrM
MMRRWVMPVNRRVSEGVHSLEVRSLDVDLLSRAILGEGQMSALETRRLSQLVMESDPTRPIVEIGTLFGSTALAMAYVKNSAQKMILVDNFCWNPYGLTADQHRRLTTERLSQVIEQLNVELVSIDRHEFFASYDGPAPALVFLDADHSYEATLEDIRWAKAVDATVICGDDYGDLFPGVIQAVQESGGADEIVEELFVMRQHRSRSEN